MFYTLHQISKEENLPLHQLKRVSAGDKKNFAKHSRTGPRGRIELNDEGRKILVALVQDRYGSGADQYKKTTGTENQSDTSANRHSELFLAQIEALRKDNAKLIGILEDERKRHDTIIMSLTNQLQEIRLALPAPPQEVGKKQVPQQVPGPFAVFKSAWRDFVGWLDSPYPQKA